MTDRPAAADHEDRRRATSDFGANLVVSAAAGTGKTSLLVERVLNAVGSGRFPLEAMAAVTFTRKAAAEMRSRLAGALEALRGLAIGRDGEAAGGDPAGEAARRAWIWLRGEGGAPAPEVARRALEALEALDRFNVSTIHAFCAEILRLYPLEAGVDPGFRPDEGAGLEQVFEREWPRFLERELGGDPARAPAWREALRRFAMEEVRGAARSLADFGAPPPAEWREWAGDPARALAPLVRPVAEGAGAVLACGPGFNPGFLRWVESARDLARAFLDSRWPGGGAPLPGGIVLDLEKSVPAVGARIARDDPAAAGRAEAFAGEARDTLRALARLDEEAVGALLEPLREFVPRFREAYLADGWVSYDGLLALTRDLLRDHPEIRLALHERFRHLLVDEFQDTSPVQYEILFFLAEEPGGAPARDAWEARLEPGRLFIVGDPKQSIYRFLKADIAAYGRAVQKILSGGGAALHLSANFRSTAPLIEALNRLFGAEFPSSGDEYQPSFQPMQAARPGGEAGPVVEIGSTGREALRAPERRRREARAIAAWIARHAGEGREFPFSRTAVLFRVTTDVGEYLEALRAAGVPLVVEGSREFLDRPEVRHLRALLASLARPHDPVPILAVLRSPSGGASDRDLLEHALAGGGWSLDEPVPPSSPAPVRRALAWLRELRGELRDLPAEDQVLGALSRSGLEIVEASHPDGAQSLANLRRYALSVAEEARERGLPLERAIAAVEARVEPGAAGIEESPLADETLEAVRVLTVHKSKGMEWDAVIVPDLCRGRPSRREREVEIDRPRSPGGGLAVRTRRGSNAWRLLHEHEEARHEKAEELRTLYVACTRARRRLVLLAGPVEPSEAERRWPAALRHWGYEAHAVPAVDGGEIAPGVAHRDASGWSFARAEPHAPPPVGDAVERFAEAEVRARGSARERERSPSGLVEREWARAEAAESPLPAAWRGSGALVGRILHLALERWDGRGDGRAVLREAVRLLALGAGLEPGETEREVEPLWRSVLESPLPALLRSAGVGGREVPILMQEDGVVWWGSLDLLYRGPDGGWVVADYKTEDPGADPRAAARRYLPQLRVYARAVARALECRPRAEIVWVRSGSRTVFSPEDLEGPLA